MNPKSFKLLSKDKLTLFGRAWISPVKSPKGIIHLIHDLGEHSGRYDHVGNALAEAGYHLVGFDMRGHGLSEGRRGHSPSFSHLLDDIQALMNESKKYLGNNLPRFLYGQGYGGNLVFHFQLENPHIIRGSIITSPAFSKTTPQTQFITNVTKVLANILPGFRFNNGFDPEALSRNSAIVQAYRKDVYVHNKISAQLYTDLHKSGQRALQNAQHWNDPLLLMHGTADRITASATSEEFARLAGELVNFICWDDFFHELHHDLGYEVVIDRMILWLDQLTS